MSDEQAPVPETPSASDPLSPTPTAAEKAVAAAVQADEKAFAVADHQAESDAHGWFRHMVRLLQKHCEQLGLDLKAEIDKVL